MKRNCSRRTWLPGANDRVRVSEIMSPRKNHLHMIEGLTERTRAFVQVQNGCDHRCTFCIIPFGRGNSRSVQIHEAVEQVRRLVANGYAEVVLRALISRPGAPISKVRRSLARWSAAF